MIDVKMNDENINNRRSILELSNEEAKMFFMKSSSYSNLDLPPYFVFDKLLEKVDKIIVDRKLSSMWFKDPKNKVDKDKKLSWFKDPKSYEDVNYTLFNNKNGKYAWRLLQLIHPVIYVSLVNEITQLKEWGNIKNRFEKFTENKKIKCLSLPVESLSDEKDKAEQVSQWWQAVEQKSIELALDFEYIFHTDIENCYGSIYTHSIAWALHTKEVAKEERNKTLIGNIIDCYIQAMSYGQTNGIPQGSVLMDFVAEMVLGYADLELSEKIKGTKIEDYFILRYRDDFRVFVNNPQDGEHILKLLTEVLIDLSMRLNSQKTTFSNDVIRSSIKADKLHWLEKTQTRRNPQKHLLIIHNHSQQFPNSSSLTVALSYFYKRLLKIDESQQFPNSGSLTVVLFDFYKRLLKLDESQQFPNSGSLTVALSYFYKRLLKLDESQQFPNFSSLTVALSYFDKLLLKLDEINKLLLKLDEINKLLLKLDEINKLLLKLNKINKRLLELDKIKKSAMPMISIVVDISFHNPNTYPIVFAILSKLISFLDNDEDRKSVCEKIEKKFQKTPNTGYMQIWLQRISMFVPETTAPSEALCQLATGEQEKIKLWKNDWISSRKLKICLNDPKIIDHKIKNELKAVISYDEIKLFLGRFDS